MTLTPRAIDTEKNTVSQNTKSFPSNPEQAIPLSK